MAHPFLVKDIAFQAGLSTATVDRVLNGRPGVRRQTAARVRAAVEELERLQEAGHESPARVHAIDVVMEAPDRFTSAVRRAFESEAGAFGTTVFRARFHFAEVIRPADMAQVLDRIRLRGTDGVVLKAPDVPEVAGAVERLEAARIPVVTLVTDLPNTPRAAYAGADNRAAGETAAYLVGERLRGETLRILVTLSSNRFRGEEEREIGFRRLMRERYPEIGIVEVSEGFGRDAATGALVAAALARHPDIAGVYSIGGGNQAVLSAFEVAGRPCRVYVAHDLDAENLDLLRSGKLSFVLHHDLRTDVRQVFRAMLARKRPRAAASPARLSAVEVITPFNIPADFLR
ncbi:LacI family DNA-binding transcriptional regulator [Shinella sp. BYT-45]|uniref:LacI family DNA-binding transcriptional regulator n=1 Tax=Shinella sp. BYT-45 TaxID=3377377 RepID=UPI00397F51CB